MFTIFLAVIWSKIKYHSIRLRFSDKYTPAGPRSRKTEFMSTALAVLLRPRSRRRRAAHSLPLAVSSHTSARYLCSSFALLLLFSYMYFILFIFLFPVLLLFITSDTHPPEKRILSHAVTYSYLSYPPKTSRRFAVAALGVSIFFDSLSVIVLSDGPAESASQ